MRNREEVGTLVDLIRAEEGNRSILLGVDRLDYTKGLRHRLEAFARALELYPELRGRVTLAQFVVPSRADIPQYVEFKRELEQLVGEINGRFTRAGWVPVYYVFRLLDRTRLLAWYRASDVGLVTPLKDGMNLVAKEYCAANPRGVLVLSEFAGPPRSCDRERCWSTRTTSTAPPPPSPKRWTCRKRSAAPACAGCDARCVSTTSSGGWRASCRPPARTTSRTSRRSRSSFPTTASAQNVFQL